MTIKRIATLLLGAASVAGFSRSPIASQHCGRTTPLRSEVATAEPDADTLRTDPKEAVKLFGRLAEKYISKFLMFYSNTIRYSSTFRRPQPLFASARCLRRNVLLLWMLW